ncbi:unnamed protein product [Sphacelaria rigidula]
MNCEKYPSSTTHDTEKHQHQQHQPAAQQRPYSNGNNDTNKNGPGQPTTQLSRKEKLDQYLARNAAMQQRKSTSTSSSSSSSSRVPVGGDNPAANHHNREVATGCGVSRPPLMRNNHPGGEAGGVDTSGATALVGVASTGEAAPRRLSTREREEDLKARLAAYQKRKSLTAAARTSSTCAQSAAVVPQEKENDDRAHQEVCTCRQ